MPWFTSRSLFRGSVKFRVIFLLCHLIFYQLFCRAVLTVAILCCFNFHHFCLSRCFRLLSSVCTAVYICKNQQLHYDWLQNNYISCHIAGHYPPVAVGELPGYGGPITCADSGHWDNTTLRLQSASSGLYAGAAQLALHQAPVWNTVPGNAGKPGVLAHTSTSLKIETARVNFVFAGKDSFPLARNMLRQMKQHLNLLWRRTIVSCWLLTSISLLFSNLPHHMVATCCLLGEPVQCRFVLYCAQCIMEVCSADGYFVVKRIV